MKSMLIFMAVAIFSAIIGLVSINHFWMARKDRE